MSMSRFKVTTTDYAMPGMERLRDQDEFILIAYPSYHTSIVEVRNDILADIEAVDRGDDFDYDAAHTAVQAALTAHFGDASLFRAVYEVDPASDGESDEEFPAFYVYVRDGHPA
jgi:hypothetical protein